MKIDHRFHAEVDAFTARLDSMIKKAGPKPEGFPKIVERRGGFCLVDMTISIVGTWIEKELYWNRRDSECRWAAKRRGITF